MSTETARPAASPPAAPTLTPAEFAHKWQGVTTGERASAQAQFIDICRMLGEPTPHDADPTGESYAFEKGAEKLGGGDGFADVWKRGYFAWEYKGKRKDLKAAYRQLNDYREDLDNPPLLVVSDLDRFEVHTNFTGTPSRVHRFTLADIAHDPTEPLRILRAVFRDHEALRPDMTPEEVTEAAAQLFGTLAQQFAARGHDPGRIAHFLDKLLFCLFAEDAALLPKDIIGRLISGSARDPRVFVDGLRELFAKMSVGGGMFGAERVDWFNGGLFDGDDVLPVERLDIKVIEAVGKLNWAKIEPAIFGTLFERSLDPGQRAQLGAHYTDRQSIWRLVEPVILAPLRREFEAMQAEITPLLLAGGKKATTKALDLFQAFLDHLRTVTVLDPACGSGNFLYLALQGLKDLEWEAIQWGSLVLRLPQQIPRVGPHQLKGIEINVYAAELARVTIWIGEIQWMLRHGLGYERNPILKPLDNIREQDALLDLSDPDHPKEAVWPDADFIVGNPPFVGGKLLRSNLTDKYVDTLFQVFDGRVAREADFVTYWHEKARAMIEAGRTKRVGLLATQGIRGGANRKVLERIKETGGIFMAWSDEPWVLAGANVHVSFVAYDDGSETERVLDGQPVAAINANLTSGLDLTQAQQLDENLGIAFMGDTKGGPFDVPEWQALEWLDLPNPDGRSNRDVLRPWANGLDIGGRPRRMWIIDFGVGLPREQAALYEAPYRYVETHVRFLRAKSRTTIDAWWLHERPRVDMRVALEPITRYMATPRVSKHRLFVWLAAEVLLDSACIAIARDDDYTFGVLHSHVHELWARGMGTQLREVESGFRYTPTTTFETFPFPHPTDQQRDQIAEIAATSTASARAGSTRPTSHPPNSNSAP